jgi:D-alanyl-D-alanine carboxypeptidase
MTERLRGWAIAAATAVTFTAMVAVAAVENVADAGGVAVSIERVVEKAQVGSKFSGTVLVGDGERVLFERVVPGLGPSAFNASARWRWASVTKQVTALLVMQEVAAGRLSLDGAVAQYLPDFATTHAAKITVRDLLRHTSGLANPDDSGGTGEGVPDFYRVHTRKAGDSNLAFCAKSPRHEPGAGFQYNNCDYIVLGAILEAVTAKSYAKLLAKRISKPLNLTTLRYVSTNERVPRDVVAGTAGGQREPAFNLAAYGAAGAIVGAPRDLLALDRALLGNVLLPAAATKEMWTGDPAIGYAALGAWAFPADLAGCATAVDLVERRGSIGGVQVRNVIAPALGRALVIFTNSGDVQFGEIWQQSGLTFELASAAFCTP